MESGGMLRNTTEWGIFAIFLDFESGLHIHLVHIYHQFTMPTST